MDMSWDIHSGGMESEKTIQALKEKLEQLRNEQEKSQERISALEQHCTENEELIQSLRTDLEISKRNYGMLKERAAKLQVQKNTLQKKYNALANSKLGRIVVWLWNFRSRFRRKMGKPEISNSELSVPKKKYVSSEEQRIFTLAEEKKTQKEIKVAAIMDRFTLECFRPECQLTELTPEGWKQEMEAAQPDLLFVESAWEGKDGLWHGKINHCSEELYELTEYCHEKNIPVVFWNKEDPVFTDTFIPAAKRADAVFTTDLECVEKYKTELGHDRVYHMHFAAQPCIHNPIEKYERKNRFCFAGAYYHRYQDRCKVFDAFSDYFIESRGLDIFDRNYLNARPEHKFPERYDPYILGNLDPSEIDVAYKGYVYGINMNSITQSQTMFARRVFELMASNTIVVGNYSRGVKNYFGDLTFCTDDQKTLRAGLEKYCTDEDAADKLRLLALRKVLREHLVEDRLDYIIKKVFGRSIKEKLPMVTVYAHVADQEEADRVIGMFRAQTYGRKKLLLVSDAELRVPEGMRIMKSMDFSKRPASELCGEGYLANFCAQDWYGKNYLMDFALTTRYGDFDAVGKADFFESVNGIPVRKRNQLAYRRISTLTARRCMVSVKMLSGLTGEALLPDQIWSGTDFMSVDAMNYCAFWQEKECAAAKDLSVADQGISMKTMENAAQNVQPVEISGNTFHVDVEDISQIKIRLKNLIRSEQQESQLAVFSELPDLEHRYFFLNRKFDVSPYLEDGQLGVLFRGEARMNLTGFCLFYNNLDQKLDAKSFKIGVRGKVQPPVDTAYMKIAYRVCGAGSAVLQGAEFGMLNTGSVRGGCFLSRSNVLVLSNNYPAPDDLYRNMFVHKRLRAYQEQGALVDVMRMNPYARDVLREFEGINVIEGQGDVLASLLDHGTIDTVCVHFLDEHMWDVLKTRLDSLRILVWVHGADIQPWWRRTFNYATEEQLEAAKEKSEKRMAFWHGVFEASKSADMKFVFVSQYFANEVFEDYKIVLPEEKYDVIHNLIDTEQYKYVPKTPADRKKLLSIRPYASKTYANDLSVKAILELSKEPWFDELEIALFGRGVLFDEVLEPLRGFPNIHIEEKFFTQSEIAALHKSYGVFLTPTRMDTQGVSRDEAMSSGLVAVTNAVAAVPEFADENCAVVVPGEDYRAMAEGIKRLYEDPELFLRLSENAAKRVRAQTSRAHTIDKEISLIWNRGIGQ